MWLLCPFPPRALRFLSGFDSSPTPYPLHLCGALDKAVDGWAHKVENATVGASQKMNGIGGKAVGAVEAAGNRVKQGNFIPTASPAKLVIEEMPTESLGPHSISSSLGCGLFGSDLYEPLRTFWPMLARG